MKIQEFIKYIEEQEGKEMEDQTILWINTGVSHKYEILLWDADFQEVTIRNVKKEHPRTKWVFF